MNIYFTSDSHFGHSRIIGYTDRPFADVEEMNEKLIENWNSVVSPKDTIYHCGDFALSRPEVAISIIARLNGRKHLIFGNHDKSLRKNKEFLSYWESAQDLLESKIEDETAKDNIRRITLCHYAMRIWNKSHYGSYQLYGHSHGSLADDPHSLSLDVGVDCWDYKPVDFHTIRERMSKKQWQPIDHHDGERD